MTINLLTSQRADESQGVGGRPTFDVYLENYLRPALQTYELRFLNLVRKLPSGNAAVEQTFVTEEPR